MCEAATTEFKEVRKRKKTKKPLLEEVYDESSPAYFSKLVKKVEAASDQLKELLTAAHLNFETAARQRSVDEKIVQIVSYGLGSVSNSTSSLYQFSFILQLSRRLGTSLELYDPVFTAVDIKLFDLFNCRVSTVNDEGRREVDAPTLFFLPHAPRFVMENILNTNHNSELSKCVLFSDNIQTIVDNTVTRVLEESYPTIASCEPIVKVVPLENNFKYSDIFNDLAFHVFVTAQ